MQSKHRSEMWREGRHTHTHRRYIEITNILLLAAKLLWKIYK